ncbi:MAG: cytochrome c oxidase assembly protein [Proteobacteria bacterium]|nr:cytochrome c oxidase assembly protein [Pseudomonadota bacterium]
MKGKKDPNLGIVLPSVILVMFAFTYACVPLYKLFCQKTGFGGTPKIVQKTSNKLGSRMITVQFVANVHRDLKWKFTPLQHEIKVRVGQNALAFFRAENLTDKPIIGMSTYNVTPDKAGQYFSKVACFCFERQLLMPGEAMDMPVQFYIDPDLAKDKDLKDVNLITLSYTFFEVKD